MLIKKNLSNNLEENINVIKTSFDDDLLKIRNFSNKLNSSIKFCLLYFASLVKNETIEETIIKPIVLYDKKMDETNVLDEVSNNILTSSGLIMAQGIEELQDELMRGKTVLLFSDSKVAFIIETNERIVRSIIEPESEKVLRGPREGFTESLLLNIALVRRKIISTDLKFEYSNIGNITKTKTAICYMKGEVDKKALKILKQRLSKIEVDGILDSNVISEMISTKGITPFKVMGVTERPDTAAAKVLEGKIAILVDGSPSVLTAPYLLIENFQLSEDYYLNYFFSSFGRLLRVMSFLVSILLPALYVAITTHHWEVLPSPLAQTIFQAQQSVPFPTIVECVFMLLIFEILREAGLRTTQGVGQSLSVVGAIVIGQAAVEARLVSSPMVIVIALTAITGLINHKLKGASIILRFTMLILASFLGVYGCLFGLFVLLLHIINIKSFDKQYVEGLFPMNLKNTKDSIFRLKKSNINNLKEDASEVTQ